MKKSLLVALMLMIVMAMVLFTSCAGIFETTTTNTTNTEVPKQQIRYTITEEEWKSTSERKNFTANIDLIGTSLNLKMTEDVIEIIAIGEHILVDRANKIMYYDTGIGWCAYISEAKYDEMYIDLGDLLEGVEFSDLEYDEYKRAYIYKEDGVYNILSFENGNLIEITVMDSLNNAVLGKIKDIDATEIELPKDYLIVDDGLPTPADTEAGVRTIVTSDEWEHNMTTSYTVKLFSPIGDMEMKCDGNTFVQRLNVAGNTQLEYYVRENDIIYKLEYQSNRFIGKEFAEGSLPKLNDLIADLIKINVDEYVVFTYNEEGGYYESDNTYLYFEDGILVRIVQIDGNVETILVVSDLSSTDIKVPKYEVEIKGPIYTLNPDGTGYVVSGIGKLVDTDIVISETYEGKPVVAIADEAFKGITAITSIDIPDSVTYIGKDAFKGCTSLKYNEYDNALYLGNNANPYLALVKAKNTSIDSCDIHSDTKLICQYAFQNCRDLLKIVVPDSVMSIGMGAFSKCSSLENISIGNSVTSMGASVFWGCDSLKYNEYENAYYLGNDENPYLILAEITDKKITGFQFLSDTKFIGESAFDSCRYLTGINIPNSIIGIGDGAFAHCSSLTSVVIPESITRIENRTFNDCTKLSIVIIGNSVKSIGQGAFDNCYSLNNIVIPDSVNIIYTEAFYGCSALTSIVIPDSVVVMERGIFNQCKALKTIYCEASSKPDGWDYYWNEYNCKVVWGYKE